MNALPITTECEILKNGPILNKPKWREIRDKAVTLNTVVYHNVADCDKLIGISYVAEVSDCSTGPGSAESGTEPGDVLICQLCSVQQQVNNRCDALKQQGADPKSKPYNRKPIPNSVTRPGPPCNSCGRPCHTSANCTTPNRYHRTNQ